MKGIPVTSKGDPLRRTYVMAGSHVQFRNWCLFSRVNRIGNWVYPVTHALYDTRMLRGVRDCDFVFTGLWHQIDRYYVIADLIRRIEENPHYTGQRYYQVESADIEPNVVSRYPGQADD